VSEYCLDMGDFRIGLFGDSKITKFRQYFPNPSTLYYEAVKQNAPSGSFFLKWKAWIVGIEQISDEDTQTIIYDSCYRTATVCLKNISFPQPFKEILPIIKDAIIHYECSVPGTIISEDSLDWDSEDVYIMIDERVHRRLTDSYMINSGDTICAADQVEIMTKSYCDLLKTIEANMKKASTNP